MCHTDDLDTQNRIVVAAEYLAHVYYPIKEGVLSDEEVEKDYAMSVMGDIKAILDGEATFSGLSFHRVDDRNPREVFATPKFG